MLPYFKKQINFLLYENPEFNNFLILARLSSKKIIKRMLLLLLLLLLFYLLEIRRTSSSKTLPVVFISMAAMCG